VFLLVPAKPELANTKLGIAISERQTAGEHQWAVKDGHILVRLHDKVVVELTDKAEILDGSGHVLGKIFPVQE